MTLDAYEITRSPKIDLCLEPFQELIKQQQSTFENLFTCELYITMVKVNAQKTGQFETILINFFSFKSMIADQRTMKIYGAMKKAGMTYSP